MKMTKIYQERQENGLWGTPYNCYKIDRFIFLDDRKWLLKSALIAYISQERNQRFEVFNSTDIGFLIQITGSANWYRFYYSYYEVIDDILYEFESEQEHINFLRKHKIKELEW